MAKSDSKSPATERKILVTAAEGQTGRLVVDLLATHEDYVEKYASLMALVFSEEAKALLEEYEDVEVIVFDPKNEKALVESMEMVDTCMLIPPARKVGICLSSLSPSLTPWTG
jgi:hypothetical protein